MSGGLWTAIGAFAGVLVTLLGVIWQLPKIRAEARKLNAEAGQLEWQTLRDEIARLEERVGAQGNRIAELEQAAEQRDDRERDGQPRVFKNPRTSLSNRSHAPSAPSSANLTKAIRNAKRQRAREK